MDEVFAVQCQRHEGFFMMWVEFFARVKVYGFISLFEFHLLVFTFTAVLSRKYRSHVSQF